MTVITDGFLQIRDVQGEYLAIGDYVVVWRPFGLDTAVIEKYNPATRQIHLRIDVMVNKTPKISRYHTPFYPAKFWKVPYDLLEKI